MLEMELLLAIILSIVFVTLIFIFIGIVDYSSTKSIIHRMEERKHAEWEQKMEDKRKYAEELDSMNEDLLHIWMKQEK